MAQPKLSDIMADARRITQDTEANPADQSRVDADLERFTIDGVAALLSYRPDLFLGQFVTLDVTTLTKDSDLPVDARYRQVMADYVVWRCEFMDKAEASNARGAAAKSFFEGRL